MAQSTGIYELSWGAYGRIIVSSDAGQLLVDAGEVTVKMSTSDTVLTGQEAIVFLRTHEGFPQAFEQSKCAPRPYLGNKYPLE